MVFFRISPGKGMTQKERQKQQRNKEQDAVRKDAPQTNVSGGIPSRRLCFVSVLDNPC